MLCWSESSDEHGVNAIIVPKECPKEWVRFMVFVAHIPEDACTFAQ